MELKENLITAIIKQPGKEPEEDPFFVNTLAAFQQAVDGPIEVVYFGKKLALICNEEGRLKGLPHNVQIRGIDFVGPIIAVGVGEDSFCSIEPAEIEFIKRIFRGGGYSCDIR